MGIKEYHPEWAMLRKVRRIQDLIADNENDIRLTEAQRHQGVKAILGCDPLLVAAKIIQMCFDRRSKWHVEPEALHRMTLSLHDRLYPTPDWRTRKREADENQFELDFQWHVEGDSRTAVIKEAAE